MIVREKEDFRGKRVPLDEWEIKLQEDFPFMEQNPDDENIYRKWGFQRDKPKTTKFRIVRGRIVFDGEVLSEIETDNADDRPSSKQSKEEKHEKQKID